MKKITRWIVSKFIKDHDSIHDLTVRSRYGALEGWVSIVINVVLFIVKITLGLAIRSVALIGDAIHTLADSGTSLVVIIGFKLAKKPSDKEHPFGHGRMESVAALIVSVLLFVAGAELIQRAIHSMIDPSTATASYGIILIVGCTIIIKELLSRFSYELGDMIDSKALKADATHHRSDVFATAMVVVALVASRLGYARIDGVMGIGVALIILYSAYIIAREAIDPLLGEPPSKEALREIGTIAMKHPEVTGVHDIIYHKYGQTSIISFHMEVSDKGNISDLHFLSEAIEDEIAERMGGMVVAHIDPVNKDHPRYQEVYHAIDNIIAEDNMVSTFHELRIVGQDENRFNAVFDIGLEENAGEHETCDIVRAIREKLKEQFPDMRTIIKAEPKYVYNV